MQEVYVESKRYNKLVNIRKKKQSYKYGEQTNGYLGGGRERSNKGKGLRGTNCYV